MKWFLGILASALGLAIGGISGFYSQSDPGDDYRNIFAMVAAEGNDASDLAVRLRPDSAPRLSVEEGREFNFGVMDVNEQRRHTFMVRNDGDAPLELNLVRTTCKCAIGELPSGNIAPGEVGEVTLEWTAKSFAQEFRQSATIETNDPQNRALILSVFGRVIQAVRAIPASLTLGDATVTDSRLTGSVFYVFQNPDLEITELKWLDGDSPATDYLALDWQPARQELVNGMPGALKAFNIMVELKPGMPRGNFSETLKLSLNAAPWKLEIPVLGRVVSDIAIAGRNFNERKGILGLGLVKQGQAHESTLLMLVKGQHREDVKFTLSEVDPSDALQVELGQPTSYATVVKYPVKVTVPKSAPAIQRRASEGSPGKIVLKSTHPKISEVEILVSFAVGE